MNLLIVCLTALAIAYVWRRGAARAEDPEVLRGHLVTVYTRRPDDQTIHGLCVAEERDRIRLVNADYLTGTGPQPVLSRDGRRGVVTIYRQNIAFLQEHDQPPAELETKLEAVA